MNETPLTPRQLKAMHDLRRGLLKTARTLQEVAERFEVAVLSMELAAREELDTPDGWLLPKDWHPTVSATNVRSRMEIAGASWQIDEHEFLEELEAEE